VTPRLFLRSIAVARTNTAHERAGAITNSLEPSHAYRETAMLLGDVIDANDAYTGSHSRDDVEFALAVPHASP
jgi:hypothetical protein